MEKEIKEFIELYRSEKEIYNCWGNYIIELINHKVRNNGINTDVFFKLPCTARLKTEKSIIEKGFYRPNKHYRNKYLEIEDKVGVRFVVLLKEEIRILEEIIESCEIWDFSKDRDFEKARELYPSIFDYESVHYVVKNRQNISLENDVIIPKNTPCEIQIRTLLQHAYSELTHDLLYKSDKGIKPNVKRIASRSMALIETTDNLFKEVSDCMNDNLLYKKILPPLEEIYREINKEFIMEPKINQFIIEAYEEIIDDTIVENINTFLRTKPFIKTKITQKCELNLVYSQPIIILLYFLVERYSYRVFYEWPFNEQLISPIYTDLAKKIPD